MYTIVSFHKILPQFLEDYIANMMICAAKSNQEPGCIRYEVMQDVDEPTLMCLTQVFRDEEAYQEHQVAEHHRAWMEISADWRDRSAHRRHLLRYIAPEPN